jgi:tetratricopeptide (TPR) repeat protein
MLTEDYLLRMINQAVAVLVKIVGLKKSGNYQEAQQAVDQALELLLGLRVDIIKRLDDESLLKALTQQDRLDIERLALMANLFKEEGDILAAQSRITESRESFLRSLTFHLDTGFDETAQPSIELTGEIESLVQKLGAQDLPDDTLWALFCYYELTGAYRKADDVILKMAARPHLYASIHPELVAFYERLLKKPTGELVESGIDREQIEHKLEKAMQNRNDK